MRSVGRPSYCSIITAFITYGRESVIFLLGVKTNVYFVLFLILFEILLLQLAEVVKKSQYVWLLTPQVLEVNHSNGGIQFTWEDVSLGMAIFIKRRKISSVGKCNCKSDQQKKIESPLPYQWFYLGHCSPNRPIRELIIH